MQKVTRCLRCRKGPGDVSRQVEVSGSGREDGEQGVEQQCETAAAPRVVPFRGATRDASSVGL